MTETIYVYNDSGLLAGIYAGAHVPPADCREVPTAPEDVRQVWDGQGWGPVPIDPKLQGVAFEGVLCSATKEDMWGLSSIAPWIAAGNSTAFEFDNGNVLVLTPDNYLEFTQVWGVFRASFFPVS